MYPQISRNKRNSIIVITGFLLVWLLAGFVIGEFAGGLNYAITGAMILGVLGVLAALYSYYLGSATVLSAVGAHEADPHQFQQLYNIVQPLAIGDGLPMPKVYIIEDPSPNAFATGRDPQHAAVTVTTGLLQMMNREELEGVLAHEMSHIKNFDVRLLLVVTTMIGLAAIISSVVWNGSPPWRRSRASSKPSPARLVHVLRKTCGMHRDFRRVLIQTCGIAERPGKPWRSDGDSFTV